MPERQPCREHSQFLEEVRAHVLHNGPRPGGQMLARATLASRSSGDLAQHDEPSAVPRENLNTLSRVEGSGAGAGGSASAAESSDGKGDPTEAPSKQLGFSHACTSAPVFAYCFFKSGRCRSRCKELNTHEGKIWACDY